MTDQPVQLRLLGEVEVAKPERDDERLISVTTVLGVLRSVGLEYWMKEQVALAFVGIRNTLVERVEEDGVDATVKWGLDSIYRKPKVGRTAAGLGTAFHAVAEEIAVTGNIPAVDDELRPLVEQYDRWLQRAQPEFTAAEMPVYSPTYGIAGTCDGTMRLQGEPLIHDFKTSRKSYDNKGKKTRPYPESALQLAAYRHAEFAVPVPPRRYNQFQRRYYLFGEDERAHAIPVPTVNGGIVIHVTPEHCDAYVARCDEEVYTTFLYIHEAARWQFDTSKTAIGNVLEFADEEVV